MPKKTQEIRIVILLVIAGLLLYMPFLGMVHLFDWDEINFAESAREMLLTGDYLTVKINFLPFWEKPPLFIWMQALSMKVFGINEFAARFPNAVVGVFTLLMLYFVGKKIYDRNFGLIWAFVYTSSFLPFFYFKSGIIDPWFNFFIFGGIYFFFLFLEQGKYKHLVLSAVSIGLATLTKGPVGLLIFALSVFFYLLIKKDIRKVLNLRVLGLYTIVFSLVGGFWFFLQIIDGKAYLIWEFIEYQIRLFTQKDAGHGGFLFYHFVVLFFGVFPASIFALKGFRKKSDTENYFQYNFRLLMIVLFWTVLILFTIVKTKIVHYSSMCYYPLTFLATFVIKNIFENKTKFQAWMKILLVAEAVILGVAVVAMTFIDTYKQKLIASGVIKDAFAVGNLQADGHWHGYEFIAGILLIVFITGALFFKKNKIKIIAIFSGSLIFIYLAMALIVPRVEEYSQKSEIDFFKSLENKDCYVVPYGYKTYAQYFYTNKQKPANNKAYDTNWLLTGKTTKPVYVICKVTKADEFGKNYPNFKKIGEKNGFVFFLKQ